MLTWRQSLDWKYLQTPQFTISTKGDATPDLDLELSVRYGAINGGSLSTGHTASRHELPSEALGLKLHEVRSWEENFCSEVHGLSSAQRDGLSEWLHKMLPRVQ